MSYTFTWGSGPKDVIVTGSFDNWSKSLPLVHNSKGSFELTVPLDLKSSEKIYYKYVVDGEWRVSSNGKIEKDSSGIENNVLYSADLINSKSNSNSAKIPESGGLSISKADVAAAAASSSATGGPGIHVPSDPNSVDAFKNVSNVDAKALNEQINSEKGKENVKDLKTTVMPSNEGKQQTLNEPGIYVPSDANSIDAFKNVSKVDAKELNEQINAEQAAKAGKEKTAAPVASTEGTSGSTSGSKKKKKVKKNKKKTKKNNNNSNNNNNNNNGAQDSTAANATTGAVGAAGATGAATATNGSGTETAPATAATSTEEVPTTAESSEEVSEAPETAPETVPEIAPETVAETVPETLPEADVAAATTTEEPATVDEPIPAATIEKPAETVEPVKQVEPVEPVEKEVKPKSDGVKEKVPAATINTATTPSTTKAKAKTKTTATAATSDKSQKESSTKPATTAKTTAATSGQAKKTEATNNVDSKKQKKGFLSKLKKFFS
ncbi:hypothetical protein PACTADRAFT_80385 [Pachysolen tannophilus NRRL Y-2460]|uniref:AMP-activated protein kinase glycogen-binding domain-containing protein n=1 Tax=Pachysolen tannophilus NRRL Y-2460 TaxID=669874 RepID=A0A1E4TX70_PACTA|nr:hypothetical protein PACTADRAFT_80385 [Pachysolen tannophilus NRRL Y-2460]